MKKLNLVLLVLLLAIIHPLYAIESINLKFNRTSNGVTVSAVYENGEVVPGVTATVVATSASNAWNTGGNMANRPDVLCQNTNTKDATEASPITFTLTINGLENVEQYKTVAFTHIAVDSSGDLQPSNNSDVRDCNIKLSVNGSDVGIKNNENIWIPSGKTDKEISFMGVDEIVANEGTVELKLTIWAGTNNAGCFYGLTKVTLAPEKETCYYISWKTTGADYITEEADGHLSVQSNDVKKAQFWQLIPTGNVNCYYIRNTATGNYIGSCNLTPSSDSKVVTTSTPVEYYVGKTSVTEGETAGCYYFSSTDCENYVNESSLPRALNKDGASNFYVITWQAGADKKGSYWTLIETPDLYEVRPFEASEGIGKIGTSYNVEALNGKNLTFVGGNLSLVEADSFDENQEWYFVGTSNNTGWQIASASEPATVVGIDHGNIVADEGLDTKWKVMQGDVKGYYYFASDKTVFKVEGDSLFRFTRLRSAYARSLKVYNNPCGAVGGNYATRIEIHGEGAVDNIIYEGNVKPSNWHVVYANDKGEVTKGDSFKVDVTLSSNAANNMTAIAHFDWNSDGIFETAQPFTLNGCDATTNVTVPEWAAETQTRMRLRLNSNGLDLAEDDVYGFIYDFHIKVVGAQENRTVNVSVNSWERGKVTLSAPATDYAYGMELTATAVAYGNAQFVCWREEGVVVSTNAEYTFTVDHNVNLVAYFTPNTDESSYPSGITEVAEECRISIVLQGDYIVAQSTDEISSLSLYTIDAAFVAQCKGNALNVTGVREGAYILRATTAGGYKNMKIYINK